MDKNSFYDSRRKEREFDFLADYRIVRQYFCRKYDLTQAEIELIWKLHSLGKFIKNDIEATKYVFDWNFHKMVYQLQTKGHITVWRERKPSEGQNYKIYQLSRRTKTMVEDFYKILCGEEPIPEDEKKNPIMKREGYSDKVYSVAIQDFNKRMAELRNED